MQIIKFTKKLIVLCLVIAMGVGVGYFSVFTLDETEKAAAFEFGKPKRNYLEAGIHTKFPWETLVRVNGRWMMYDSKTMEIITRDKKTLAIDDCSLWRITDPIVFLQTVQTIDGAQHTLDEIIYSILRAELGKNKLKEVVKEKRSEILALVTKKSAEALTEYGITTTMVRLNKVDLPDENKEAVYKRMIAERGRQAEKYRSEGNEEATKITSGSDLKCKKILADAKMEAKGIKGAAEAEVTKIWNDSFGSNLEFFKLYLALDTAKKSMGPDSGTVKKFILTGDELHLAPLFQK